MLGHSSTGRSAAVSAFREARCSAERTSTQRLLLATPHPRRSEAGATLQQWGSFIEVMFALIY